MLFFDYLVQIKINWLCNLHIILHSSTNRQLSRKACIGRQTFYKLTNGRRSLLWYYKNKKRECKKFLDKNSVSWWENTQKKEYPGKYILWIIMACLYISTIINIENNHTSTSYRLFLQMVWSQRSVISTYYESRSNNSR